MTGRHFLWGLGAFGPLGLARRSFGLGLWREPHQRPLKARRHLLDSRCLRRFYEAVRLGRIVGSELFGLGHLVLQSGGDTL